MRTLCSASSTLPSLFFQFLSFSALLSLSLALSLVHLLFSYYLLIFLSSLMIRSSVIRPECNYLSLYVRRSQVFVINVATVFETWSEYPLCNSFICLHSFYSPLSVFSQIPEALGVWSTSLYVFLRLQDKQFSHDKFALGLRYWLSPLPFTLNRIPRPWSIASSDFWVILPRYIIVVVIIRSSCENSQRAFSLTFTVVVLAPLIPLEYLNHQKYKNRESGANQVDCWDKGSRLPVSLLKVVFWAAKAAGGEGQSEEGKGEERIDREAERNENQQKQKASKGQTMNFERDHETHHVHVDIKSSCPDSLYVRPHTCCALQCENGAQFAKEFSCFAMQTSKIRFF